MATYSDFVGFARFAGPFATFGEAFAVASEVVEACRLEQNLPPFSVIGDFVVPPLGAEETRDFQTLHFDFGLPLNPRVEQDVALYTALYIPADVASIGAVTRLLPLIALLHQRSWRTGSRRMVEHTAPGTMTEATSREASPAWSRPRPEVIPFSPV
jgi:hypothetical protein